MSFDTSAYLRKATSRAKSDVANKLVSMMLHEISRRIVSATGLGVTDAAYANAVAEAFADKCAYCGRLLELDRAAVEHLDGMNRFRVGLHVPGNVVVSCIRCNREKRRDDQLAKLVLAENGWQSFLSHDSTKCASHCKTCVYWKTVWLNPSERSENLRITTERIVKFRSGHIATIEASARARELVKQNLDLLYRECQAFAAARIESATDALFQELGLQQKTESKNRPPDLLIN